MMSSESDDGGFPWHPFASLMKPCTVRARGYHFECNPNATSAQGTQLATGTHHSYGPQCPTIV